MSSEIQPYQDSEISTSLDNFSEGLSGYLNQLGLPVESVLVEVQERLLVIQIVPIVIGKLNPSQLRASMYISKFIVACSVGLFDAALNYLWDETVRNLREKVARFDLDYFYDSVILDSDRRSKLKDENDLVKLDDWVLIKGCHQTGIISDIGYRHLDFIRDMRNYASAAHPNHNELTGLQLTDWLQTCIREVLGKEPTGPVIEVRKLLYSLRQEIFSKEDVRPIVIAIQELNDDISKSLLRTVFGMYTDTKLATDIKNNIRLIAKEIWEVCSDEARYDIGLKHDSFSVNGELPRTKLARDFLELVDGLAYLSPASRAVEINMAIEALSAAHNGYNNFYNELPHARNVATLIPDNGDIPTSVVSQYVKTITLCKIGNQYGVARDAEPIYDKLIRRWQDTHIINFASLLLNSDVNLRLEHQSCATRYKNLAKTLLEQTSSSNIKEVLNFIADFHTIHLAKLGHNLQFQQKIKRIRRKI